MCIFFYFKSFNELLFVYYLIWKEKTNFFGMSNKIFPTSFSSPKIASRLFNRRLNLIDMTKTSVQFFPLKIISDYIMIKVPNKWGDIYSSEDWINENSTLIFSTQSRGGALKYWKINMRDERLYIYLIYLKGTYEFS